MARNKVTNLNIAATMDTKGVDDGTKRIERSFDRIERKAKQTKSTLDTFSDQVAGRFIALGAIISQTDRALNILYQTMAKGDSQSADAPWWQNPSGGGGSNQWKQFGIDSARNAISIGIGIALQRYGGSLLKAGWQRAGTALNWTGKAALAGGALGGAQTVVEATRSAPSQPVKTGSDRSFFDPMRWFNFQRSAAPTTQKSGIGSDTLGLLSLTAIPSHLYSTAATYGAASMGEIGAAGAGAVGSSAVLAAVVAGASFYIGKAISDAFGGKQYRMSEGIGTIGGWLGISRSNASYKREASAFYASAPALHDQIERKRAARLAVQMPVLDMVKGMMSPAVALNAQRDKIRQAVQRGMLSGEDASLIESRLMSGSGRFASGRDMPMRSNRKPGELTNTDKILIRIAERLETGIPVKLPK